MKLLKNIVLGMTALLLAGNVFALDLPIRKINGKEHYYYTVKRGENVISISQKLGISRADIVRHNPGAADGVRDGSTLYFPVSEYKLVEASANNKVPPTGKPLEYRIKRGETLFGLSHRFGVTPDQIIALNPKAENGIKAGEILLIPVYADAPVEATDPRPQTGRDPEIVEVETINEVPQTVTVAPEVTAETAEEETPKPVGIPVTPPDPSISDPEQVVTLIEGEDDEELAEPHKAGIALMLPLMLDGDASSKQARSATDFLRGFMLGVKSLERQVDNNITVRVYDTNGDASTISGIMAKPELADIDIIVAPDDALTLAAISSKIEKISPDGYVFNLLMAQDTTYRENQHILQGPVPHNIMFDKATDALLSVYEGYTPVFLISKGGRSEKIAFTDMMRAKYAETGVEPIEISYQGLLTSNELDGLDPDQRYVFIPGSGSLSEFNKFARAIKSLRERWAYPSAIGLIGYPDWTTFRGDALDLLHSLNAVIYSRFYADANSSEVKTFAAKFELQYGSPMIEQVPSQALMGYDAARYLISSMIESNGHFVCDVPYRGLQSSYTFGDDTDDDTEGYSNQSIYIITFQDGTNVGVQVL